MAYNVLVVDDSSAMRAVIRKTIEISGFSVGAYFDAANGLEALEILKNNWVDLVLTDYNMPEMNGLELIEEMKRNELFSAIPIVVITTEGSEQMVQQFLENGAAGYIQKPFTPEDIRDKLNDIIGETENGLGSTEGSDENLDF
jgi:two-component system, chemotaxis family, chemotaxis protein CheY